MVKMSKTVPIVVKMYLMILSDIFSTSLLLHRAKTFQNGVKEFHKVCSKLYSKFNWRCWLIAYYIGIDDYWFSMKRYVTICLILIQASPMMPKNSVSKGDESGSCSKTMLVDNLWYWFWWVISFPQKFFWRPFLSLFSVCENDV